MPVLTPMPKSELLKILDSKAQEVIRYFIKKSLFSQPEPLPEQLARAVQVPKEHIEQWFVQALDVMPIGAGSYPVDIYNEEEGWAADIKMLNAEVDGIGRLTNKISGEASLGQKFQGAGVDLDMLFKDKQYETIKDSWLSIFRLKISQVEQDLPTIKKIIYLFVLRAGSNFYLIGCEVDVSQLRNVSVGKTTDMSVYLKNFIENRYGNAKIYKSKKRLELRLSSKTWVDDGLAILFKTNFKHNHIRLYDEELNEEFLQEQFDRINSIRIDIV